MEKFYTSGGEVTVDVNHPIVTPGGAQVWHESFFSVDGLTTNVIGQQTARITFENITTGSSELAMLGSARDRRAVIFLYYAHPQPGGGANTVGPEMVFEGFMDGAAMNDQSLTLNLISRSTYYGSVPRLVLGPDTGVNHAPMPGVTWGWGTVENQTIDKRRT